MWVETILDFRTPLTTKLYLNGDLPRTADAGEQECDDACLARDVDAEPRPRRHELHDALHLAGALQEGQELLALGHVARHVSDPARRRPLLVVNSLGRPVDLQVDIRFISKWFSSNE